MAEQLLMFKKTEDHLTWAILGDTEEGEDFLNWDNEHPTKITLRIFSKNDTKLDAIMSSLNGTVLANFDPEDWFDCLFHSVFWYGLDVMDTWYEEDTIVPVATGDSGDWIPASASLEGIAPDPLYGNSSNKIDDTWEYFKFIDYDLDRSVSASDKHMTMSGVLGLSHTGDGDPAKLAYFVMSFDFSNISTCKLRKEVYYIDAIGGSLEKSVDRLYAEEWDAVRVGDMVTPYNADAYEENKTATVIAVGTDPEDDDLKYITFSVPPGAVNIETVNDILDKDFGSSVVMVANLNDNPIPASNINLATVSWTELAPNVWGSTDVAVTGRSTQNLMLLYSPTYDVYSMYMANKSYNGSAYGDFNVGSFGKAPADSSNTVLESTEYYNTIFTGSKTVVMPTQALMAIARDNGMAIDSWQYSKTNLTAYADPTFTSATAPTPTSGTGPGGDYTYCFGFAGDYDAYLSDYEIAEAPEPEKSINRLYAEEWDAATVGTDKVHDYDSTTAPSGTGSIGISEKGSSIDTTGVKYVVINGTYYAYAFVGDYDAFITEFNKHTCSSDPGPSPSGDPNQIDLSNSDFSADSNVGDTWTDPNGNTWTVDSKNTSSGNTYLIINTADGGEGYLAPVKKVIDALVNDGTADTGYFIPYGEHTCPTDNSLQYMTVANENTDPALVKSKDVDLVHIEDGYVVVKEWDASDPDHANSMTLSGLTHTKGTGQTAVKFDENSKTMVIMKNLATGLSASQATSLDPSELLFGSYTNLYDETIDVLKNLLGASSLDSYVVYNTDEFTLYNFGSTSSPSFYQVYKKMPFTNVVSKKPTSLSNAFDSLNGISVYSLSTRESNYWKAFLAAGGTDWGAPAVGNKIGVVIDNATGKPKDVDVTGSALFTDIGYVFNGTVGNKTACMGYASDCNILSLEHDPSDWYHVTATVQFMTPSDTGANATGGYGKFEMQQNYISNTNKPISLLSVELSETPF